MHAKFSLPSKYKFFVQTELILNMRRMELDNAPVETYDGDDDDDNL